MFATRFVPWLIRVAGFGCAARRLGWGHIHFAVRCSLFALLAVPASAQDCYYTWERIRDPGGGGAAASALNNHGMAAGTIYYIGDNTRAFTWTREGEFFRLPLPPGIVSMSANGINDLGQVVGTMHNNAVWYGFIWHSATQTYTTIPLPQGNHPPYFNDINNRGEVVGATHGAGGVYRPFVWQDGVYTFLHELTGPRDAFANAVNELGDVAGYAYDAMGRPHAFLIVERQSIAWLPEPAATPNSRAFGLNNNGIVVGRSGGKGIVWTQTSMYEIPPAANAAVAYCLDVNDAGVVVGSYYNGGFDRPFAWQCETAIDMFWIMQPRPSTIGPGQAINNLGQMTVLDGVGSLLVTPHWIQGDLTGDCHVGLDDLALLLTDFGFEEGTFPQSDLNLDGRVDLVDLAILLSHYGT